MGDRIQENDIQFVLDLAAGLTQVLEDGTNTYLYGNERIAQFTGMDSAYFLGDALGSVRQLADGDGTVTLAKNYDPYGQVLSSAGSASSNYAFTGEWELSCIKLINLRSRLYSPETGRFLTRDSWQGNYTRPTSLNKWIYVEDNPSGFVDPLGMSRRSYLIFFPGAGNTSGKPDDNEQNFLDNLQIAINNTGKQINIATIFPYGTGSINQGENSLDVIQEAAFGLDKGVTEAKVIQIWNYVVGGTPFRITTFFNNHRCNYVPEGYNQLNDEVSLNLLGYSGGGQIAYTTAQRLTGRLFVDNLILFGAPWRAYNGTNNIGHIWEVWGEGDLNEWFLDINQNYGGMAYNLTGWRSYNMGFPTSQNVYLPWLDIYQKENVRQDVFGDASINHNSYFSDKKLPSGKSMRDEMINYIINTVGVP